MPERDRTLPLTNIGEHFNITLLSPPPFRNGLDVKADALDTSLKTLHLADTSISILFLRNEPTVTVAPSSPGNITETTKDAATKTEIRRLPPLVSVDGQSGNVTYTISYSDKETQTAQKTASLASKKIEKALGKTPGIRYIHEMLKRETDVRDESAILFSNLTISAASSAIIAALQPNVMENLNTYGERFLVFFPLAYLFNCTYDVVRSYLHKNGVKVDRRLTSMYDFIARDPREAFIPVIFIEEVIIPSGLYSIRKLAMPPFIGVKNDRPIT